jgi:hypothetical protein
MRPRRPATLVLVAAAGVLFGLSQPADVGAQRKVQHIRGQNVAPVFDGYEPNPDGTFSLWFGYLNRNLEEHVEVPVGADNAFEPGPADRGQPTHFVPSWQKSAFRVVVPKDFGKKTLTWRLASKGKTETVVASLDPRSIIDRRKTTIEGTVGENLAPEVRVSPASHTITVGENATFSISATDDGRPADPRTKKPVGLSVRWRKYRGPLGAPVTFTPPSGTLVDGKSTVSVSFREAGDYVLQSVVDDGSLMVGTYCCWINNEVRVTVRAK